jgi:hypothetical protein
LIVKNIYTACPGVAKQELDLLKPGKKIKILNFLSTLTGQILITTKENQDTQLPSKYYSASPYHAPRHGVFMGETGPPPLRVVQTVGVSAYLRWC